MLKSKREQEGGHKKQVADLIVTPLVIGSNINPLYGHPIIERDDSTMFTGGFNVRLTLTHDKKSQDTITIAKIQPIIQVVSYTENALPDYEVDSTKLPPQGFVAIDRFFLTINNGTVQSAGWIESSNNQTNCTMHDNLLASNPPKEIKLDNQDNVITLDGVVSVFSTGIYETKFKFVYVVKGVQKEHHTKFIQILFNE